MKKFISLTIGGDEEYISANDITSVDVASAVQTVIYFANGTKGTLVTVGATAATAKAEWNRIRKVLAETSWTNVVEPFNIVGSYTSVTSITIATI
jgi:hypothetical protein